MAHDHDVTDLTRNQTLVYAALTGADGPMSAYTILDHLREEGFRAPLQVYRALEKLVERGLVHRIESLNAFVACRHPQCETHDSAAFMICDQCGDVQELTDTSLVSELGSLAKGAHFKIKTAMVELRGTCEACQSAS